MFPPETIVGDVQCLGILITDDNDVNDLRVRSFSVELVSTNPLVRVTPGRGTETMTIIDNERKFRQNFHTVVSIIMRYVHVYKVHTFLSLIYTGTQVEFQKSEYTVLEGDDVIEVCVQLVGDTITEEGQALVFSESGTADGEQ